MTLAPRYLECGWRQLSEKGDFLSSLDQQGDSTRLLLFFETSLSWWPRCGIWLWGEAVSSKKQRPLPTAIWVLQRSTPASLIPATTEAAARRLLWALSVNVLRAGLAPPAPQVSLGLGLCPFWRVIVLSYRVGADTWAHGPV